MSSVSSNFEFPVGLRVLVVDDDVTCLKILEHMLQRCRYHVTTCCQATVALSLLREREDNFDIILSDVHMPDMNGFKLLEHVGLEMDLPVIMMSADGGTSTVMRGIKHGACDYLIKPVRMEELKNIWQHVVRKKHSESRRSVSNDDSYGKKRVADDSEYASSVNDGTDCSWKSHKKKRDIKEDEDDGELDQEDQSSSKKPRVVWSVELHQQFVSAVSQLGIEKAVPKRILELMNVPGLTRENVASHLQKFRLYLKRISSAAQHQNGLPTSLCGPTEPTTKSSTVGPINYQTLASLQSELLGCPSVFLARDPQIIQDSRKGSKCTPNEHEVTFDQPLFKLQSSMPKSNISFNDFGGTSNAQNSSMIFSEQHNQINVQPSCMIVRSASSNCSNVAQSSLPLNQNSMLVPSQSSNAIDYYNFDSNLLQSLSNNGEITSIGALHKSPCSISSSMSYNSAHGNTDNRWQLQYSDMNTSNVTTLPVKLPNLHAQGSEQKIGRQSDQGRLQNLGFVGKGIFIPSRFAVDDIESPTNAQMNTCIGNDAGIVKQKFHLGFTDNAQLDNIPHFSSNNFTHVLTNRERMQERIL